MLKLFRLAVPTTTTKVLPIRSLTGLSEDIRRRTLVASGSSPKSTRDVRDYPSIRGASEIHIFLNPLCPSKEWLDRYNAAVEEFNKTVFSRKGAATVMRPVYLCLNFRNLGDVYVMQSARHVSADSTDYVIEEAYYDGKFFADRGFDVLRHKIEAYGGSDGVPITDEEAAKFGNRYWEFHLRVNRKSDSPTKEISKEEIVLLKQLSEDYTQKWKIPVPLSYNCYKEGRQRFLNLRIGGCGRDTALKAVNLIKNDIANSKDLCLLEVGKAHTEYVWYDDNRDLDRGWIDFTEDEQRKALKQ